MKFAGYYIYLWLSSELRQPLYRHVDGMDITGVATVARTQLPATRTAYVTARILDRLSARSRRIDRPIHHSAIVKARWPKMADYGIERAPPIGVVARRSHN